MTTGAMHCTYCGRPAEALVWVNGFGYHQECTRGPGFQPTYWSAPEAAPSVPMLFGITEDRLRQIVREELALRKTP